MLLQAAAAADNKSSSSSFICIFLSADGQIWSSSNTIGWLSVLFGRLCSVNFCNESNENGNDCVLSSSEDVDEFVTCLSFDFFRWRATSAKKIIRKLLN